MFTFQGLEGQGAHAQAAAVRPEVDTARTSALDAIDAVSRLMRNELGAIRVQDFDMGRRLLTVFGKGQKERVLPLRGRIVRAARLYERTPLRHLERLPEPDDYLIYPEWRKKGRVYHAYPKRQMPSQSLHRWWYEHLQRAGLVAEDVERGMNMHRSRHTSRPSCAARWAISASCSTRSATRT